MSEAKGPFLVGILERYDSPGSRSVSELTQRCLSGKTLTREPGTGLRSDPWSATVGAQSIV